MDIMSSMKVEEDERLVFTHSHSAGEGFFAKKNSKNVMRCVAYLIIIGKSISYVLTIDQIMKHLANILFVGNVNNAKSITWNERVVHRRHLVSYKAIYGYSTHFNEFNRVVRRATRQKQR